MTNKLEHFFKDKPFLKRGFIEKIEEGYSLRRLQAYLEGAGVSVSIGTIHQFLRQQDLKLRDKRYDALEEKKSEPSRANKIREFFETFKHKTPEQCQHLTWTEYYDLWKEEVVRICSNCKKEILRYSPDDDSRRADKNPNNRLIYEVLKRKK